MTIRSHTFALTLAIVASIPTWASASTPLGRHIFGIVQRINIEERKIELLRTDTGETLSFIWNNGTSFGTKIHSVKAAIIQEGAKVEVVYRRPFFGPAFITKVTLLSVSEGVP